MYGMSSERICTTNGAGALINGHAGSYATVARVCVPLLTGVPIEGKRAGWFSVGI
jgi:hypothetical protein